MEKYVVLLNLVDGLENCNVLRVLETHKHFCEETGETVGYNVLEVESNGDPILTTSIGNYIPMDVDKKRTVTIWKPVA